MKIFYKMALKYLTMYFIYIDIHYIETNEETAKRLKEKLMSMDALHLGEENRERGFHDVATPGDPLILYFVIDQSGSIKQEDFDRFMLLCEALIEKVRHIGEAFAEMRRLFRW